MQSNCERDRILEVTLERELHQARIGSLFSAGDDSEIRVVGGATNTVRRGELRAVKQIENLDTKFDPRVAFASQRKAFK